MAPDHLSVRQMREEEKALVVELLKDGVKDTENRVALHALTRPPALLLLAAASSGLRFVLASFALALLLPVALAVAALKLMARMRPGSSGSSLSVARLAVARWHRRRGVGTKLLAFAEARAWAWARQAGGPRAKLIVPAPVGARGATALLEGRGYHPEGGWGWMGHTFVKEFTKEF